MHVLSATENPFRGIVINPQELPEDPQAFQQQLAHSLADWKDRGLRVVWLEVPIHKSTLIPLAVAGGFQFHHAGTDYLMLTLRLEEDAFIPPYATHYIGAGGVVINDEQNLLVVCEKHRRRNSRPYYKLPGGALRPGEHLAEGAMREVQEETGVRTRFDYLVCFRHWHGYRYGKSDIYFVCRLSPLNHDISKQDEEIEECLWMPVDDYLNSNFVGAFNRHIVRAALNNPGHIPTFVDGYSDPGKHEIFMPVAYQKSQSDSIKRL